MKAILMFILFISFSTQASSYVLDWWGTQELQVQNAMITCDNPNGLPGQQVVWVGYTDPRMLYSVSLGGGSIDLGFVATALPERYTEVSKLAMDSMAIHNLFAEIKYLRANKFLVYDDTTDFPLARNAFLQSLTADTAKTSYIWKRSLDSMFIGSGLHMGGCLLDHLNAGNLPLSLYRTKNRATPAGLGILRWVDLVGRTVRVPAK